MADAKVKLGEAIVDKVDDLLAKYTKRVGAVTGGEPSSAALAEAEKIIAEKGAKVTPDQLLVEVKSRLEKGSDLAPTKFTVKDSPEAPEDVSLGSFGSTNEKGQFLLPAAPDKFGPLEQAGPWPKATAPSKTGRNVAAGAAGAGVLGGAMSYLNDLTSPGPKRESVFQAAEDRKRFAEQANKDKQPPDTRSEAAKLFEAVGQPTKSEATSYGAETSGSSAPTTEDTAELDALKLQAKESADALERMKAAYGKIPNLSGMKALSAADLPDTVEYVDEKGEKVVGRPEDMLSKAVKDANNELATLAAEYKVTEDALERRELASDLVRAVANIAAGFYGLKNGVDMSGMKFDPIDWVRRQELERAKYADRRDAAGAKFSARKDMARGLIAQRDMKRDEVIKMIDSANNRIKSLNDNARTKFDAEMTMEKMKLESKDRANALAVKLKGMTGKEDKDATSKEIRATNNINTALAKATAAEAKGDDGAKAAAMVGLMEANNQYTNLMGVPYIAPAYFTTTGWLGGKSPAEPSDIADSLLNDLTSKPTSAKVKILGPDGNQYMVPPEDVEGYIQQGAKRL